MIRFLNTFEIKKKVKIVIEPKSHYLLPIFILFYSQPPLFKLRKKETKTIYCRAS